MNLHVVQNPETALELENLCRVPLQIISPQSSCPVIGICQDSLVGAFLMTDDKIKLTPAQFQQIIITNTNYSGEMPPVDKKGFITGKQALSTILPPIDMYYGGDDPVKIVDGQIVSGKFGKAQLGAKTNSLTHIIFNDASPDDALRFLDNEQQVVNNFLLTVHGFSVGLSDCVLSKKDKREIEEIIRDKLGKAYELLKRANQNILENKFGKNPSDDFEDQITQALNKIREDTKVVERIHDKHNRFLAMTISGSKGADHNLGHIMSCVGQQVVAVKQPDTPTFKQQRIPYNTGKIKGGFDGRTLPHFHRHDDSPKARGFCKNSFLGGLDPVEFFFHNSSGREGLIDTAIKSVTGDTPIMIIENGIPKRVLIGEWIDEHLKNRPDDIKRLPEKDQELMNLNTKTYIPTCDDDGNVTWGEMTAVTRHDPGREMYKVTTQGGRSVTVVESKSLIVWDAAKEKFLEKPTPELKIGDFLPVTQNLPAPPVIIDSIDMTDYFPKSKYLYSRDFFIAKSMYEEMMSGRRQAVRGWWERHNGHEFVLPYTRIQNFARVLTRSYVDFREDCVYPYDGNRTCGHLPANFKLDADTGHFLGIYLADGDTDRAAGSVRISNNSEEIMTFVRGWFDRYGIKHEEYDKPHRTIKSISHAIRGYSRMLADLIDNIANRHSHHKYVPSVSLCAPRDHVIGVLEGYYSCEGSVSKTSIQSNSASHRLTEGISMLASRIDSFGRRLTIDNSQRTCNVTDNIADSHRIDFYGKHANKLSCELTLLKALKHAKMMDIDTFSFKKYRYSTVRDVVMDPVATITRLSSEAYQKVYDVTVPSTMNFAIADGLICRDTADTGYLQRRLIKLMEDGKVYYDGTVRNNSRLILQFTYGSDGFEATKLEKDYVCKNIYSMNDAELFQNFNLSAHEDYTKIVDVKIRGEIKKDSGFEELLHEDFQKIVRYRDLVRHEIFEHPVGKSSLASKSGDSIETHMPINMARLINNTKIKFRVRKKLSDLNPRYVIERVDQLLDKISGRGNVKGQSSDYLRHEAAENHLLHRIIVKFHLATKKVLAEHRLTKDMFDYIVLAVEEKFLSAMAQAGDMVGIIAAQSLGQPTTQMTLNSFHYSTPILIDQSGIIRQDIGAYVDEIIENANDDDIEHHPNDTKLVKTHDGATIPSCDVNGKVSWRRIEAVTRHPVVNEDGSNTLLQVKMKSGREVIATKAKSFLKRVENKIIGVNGDSLAVGDYLPVSNICPAHTDRVTQLNVKSYLPDSEWILEDKHIYPRRHRKPGSVGLSATIPLDSEWGSFVGAYLAEGSSTKYTVSIANADDAFQHRLESFCTSQRLTWSSKIKNTRNEGFGDSQSFIINGYAFSHFITSLIGSGSSEKRIPAFLLEAPKQFLAAMIAAYYDGDGAFDKRQYVIRTYSVSHGLLEDIQQVLLQFDVQCHIIQESMKVWQSRVVKHPTASRGWYLTIKSCETERFRAAFAHHMVVVPKKKERLLEMKSKMLYSFTDIVPDIVTQQLGTITEKRMHLPKLLSKLGSIDDRNVILDIMKEDIVYDRIDSIAEIANDKPWVYDLTVEGTRNFTIYNGLNVRDTFHTSGISTQFNVVDGVPRLEELISASAKPKAPAVTIYLKHQFIQDEDRAEVIRNKLRQTRLSDLARMSEIVYDPSDQNTLLHQDVDFLNSYYAFMRDSGCNFDSNWVLRLELDKEKMLDRNIRMWEIEYALLDRFSDQIQCVFADDNAANLTVRIRISNDAGMDRPEDDQDVIFLLKQVEKSLMDSLVLRGIEGIKNAFLPSREARPYIQQIEADGGIFDSNREIVIIAEQAGVGESSLLEILKLPEVDEYRTLSNYVGDMYTLFGIEAARNLLLREILKVFSTSDINHRHIEMLVDTMTCKGDLTKINRVGIHKLNVGPLARSSFEETETQFMNAAAFAEEDNFKGVSANLMLGQYYPGGTGECEILLDEDMLIDNLKQGTFIPETIPEEEAIPEVAREDEVPEEVTGKQKDVKLGFDFHLDDDVEAPFELNA